MSANIKTYWFLFVKFFSITLFIFNIVEWSGIRLGRRKEKVFVSKAWNECKQKYVQKTEQ